MKFTSSIALVALSSIAQALPFGGGHHHHHPPGNGTIFPSGTGAVGPVGTGFPSIVNRAASATTTDSPVGYASTNGGTTGGAGGTTTTVSSLAQFTAAVKKGDNSKKVIYVSGEIKGATKVYVGSNTSLLGLNSESSLVGIGLYIKGVSNVIVRNLKLGLVLAENGDAVGIQASKNVWIDHNELYSDMDHDKDYYDGLCDITHASEWVTVSNNYFHDHHKASLTGHSDSNGDEDTGHLHVTYANNYWYNIASRAPSVRFGTVHIINQYYDTITSTTINTREKAQVLVESTVFSNAKEPITAAYSDVEGYANTNDIVLGGGTNDAPTGTLTSESYAYTLLGSAKVKAAVVGTAGNTLTLG